MAGKQQNTIAMPCVDISGGSFRATAGSVKGVLRQFPEVGQLFNMVKQVIWEMHWGFVHVSVYIKL